MALINAILEEVARRGLRRERLFRDRSNVLEVYDDEALIRDFRFPRATILEIVEMCGDLKSKTNRNLDLPVHINVLAALRFFARASFQDDGKDIIGISQRAFGRAIHNVTGILCSKASEFIKFGNEAEIMERKQYFFEMYGFPNIIGLVDGSHVFIQTPTGPDEPLYVCRKGGHSINVQLICDHEGKFLDIVARWPGATHDSFIWMNCNRRATFITNPPNGWLLGDSGYGIEPWLLTPYDEDENVVHKNYNKSHKKTRSLVERSIGLWKNTFRRFDRSGGVLVYKPWKVCRMIIAGAVLHNMRRNLRLNEDEDFLAQPELYETDIESVRNTAEAGYFAAGNAVREDIAKKFFP